jgi:hypothetical protein
VMTERPQELAAILPRTRLLSTTGPGTLIVVDDNMQVLRSARHDDLTLRCCGGPPCPCT